MLAPVNAAARIVKQLFSLFITGRQERSGDNDTGMSTSEYAVGTVAAVAFAVVLYKVVRSDAVSSALSSIVRSALHTI